MVAARVEGPMTDTSDAWSHRIPAGGARAGRLRFGHGVAPRVEVRGAALGDELARCRFEGDAPRIEAREGELAIDYRGFFRWLFLGRLAPGTIEINYALPWSVHVEGGIARARLDLASVRLTRLDVTGGAAELEVRLPKPAGQVPIRIGGGAARLRLVVPEGTAARIKITGGCAGLEFLEQSLGAVGGGLELESRRWDPAGEGYEIRIGGGAAHVKVESEMRA